MSLGFLWGGRDQIEGESPGERVVQASQEWMAFLVTLTLNLRYL